MPSAADKRNTRRDANSLLSSNSLVSARLMAVASPRSSPGTTASTIFCGGVGCAVGRGVVARDGWGGVVAEEPILQYWYRSH